MLAGSIYLFAGNVVPEGFLVCDGSAVSRSTYEELFDAIGTTFGTGDGSSTFNLPDLTGRVALGISNGHSLASTGGEETHALIDAEIPSHVHEVPQHGHGNDISITTPELTHSCTQPAYNYNRPNGTTGYGNLRPTAQAYSGTSSSNASRSGSIVVNAHPASDLTVEGSIVDCPAFDTDTTGESVGHNNMQPYITLHYIIYTGV